MTARFVVGDTREVTASLPDASVDLLLSSPPFLSLRSYLPMDHPDKALEIGSESDPAAFIDVLLELTAEWRRVLAPHGSICVELGDTFSGSGGSGGDYADAGWRAGQERWGGSASRGRASQWSYPDALWLAGVLDTEGSIFVHHQQSDGRAPVFVPWVRVSMMDREICDRAALISGVGLVTQDKRRAYTWACSAQQARYVLTNLWPYLLIKQRQAKASIELSRHIDEEKRRGLYGRVSEEQIAYRMMIREYVTGLNGRGENRGVYVPTWEPPTPPRVSHAQIGGTGWPLPKSLALVPELYRVALAYGLNPLTGAPSPAGRWRVRNVVRWVRPNPPVGALGDKWRPGTSELVVACTATDRYFDLDATRGPASPNTHARSRGARTDLPSQQRDGNWSTLAQIDSDPAAGAPPLDWWVITGAGYAGAHYATWPPALCERPIEAMCPRRVCRTCGAPSRRIAVTTNALGYAVQRSSHRQSPDGAGDGRVGLPDVSGAPNAIRETLGWSSCGCPDTDGLSLDGYHSGTGWRPGLVFDPFVGSGTTLVVAHGHSRDSIGADLDPRNAQLAAERLGMFLEIINHKQTEKETA